MTQPMYGPFPVPGQAGFIGPAQHSSVTPPPPPAQLPTMTPGGQNQVLTGTVMNSGSYGGYGSSGNSGGYGSYFDDPRLSQARDNYQNLQGQAVQSQSQGYTLPQMLRDALTKKFADNPLIQSREGALKNYLDTTASSNAAMLPGANNGAVFSPSQQASLIGARNSAALAPLATQNYLLGLQSGGIPNIIEAAGNAQKAQTADLTGRAQIAETGYKDLLNELSTRANYALEQKKMEMQYGSPSMFAALSSALNGGQGTPSVGSGGTDDRARYQQIYNSTFNQNMKDVIEKDWAAKHPGQPLFASPLSSADLGDVKGTQSMLRNINQALDLVNKPNIPLGAGGGNIQDFLINGQMNPLKSFTQNFANRDTFELNRLLTALKAGGETSLIHGRLTGYLQKALGGAFPSITQDPAILKDILNKMQQAGTEDLNTFSQAKGYGDYTNIPGISPSALPTGANGNANDPLGIL